MSRSVDALLARATLGYVAAYPLTTTNTAGVGAAVWSR